VTTFSTILKAAELRRTAGCQPARFARGTGLRPLTAAAGSALGQVRSGCPDSASREAITADTLRPSMTAKEKLHQAVEELTELEAEQMLEVIARRRERDPMIAAFEDAPEDDEPFTDEEAAEADEAWEQYKRGEAIPLDEIRRELG
jgi:hypothetical protein